VSVLSVPLTSVSCAERAWANCPHRRTKRGEASTCPWCGTLPFVQGWHGGGPTKVLVGCESDRCALSPCVTGETLAEALRNWNRRRS
jgi:hypothetical protein